MFTVFIQCTRIICIIITNHIANTRFHLTYRKKTKKKIPFHQGHGKRRFEFID